jgi:fructan beta-fructosidase
MRLCVMRGVSQAAAITVCAAAATFSAAAAFRDYDEPLRPQFHFTPARNFMNDPNGLVFYKGEYHLFYQHNPFGNRWGHMSWGHAVSHDLLHWEHLPVALREEDGVMIFSGSGVVDRNNSSGLCRQPGDDPSCLVAIYTGHGHGRQTQNIAFSNDRGRTWTKYANNPVLDLGLKDFRDPKVLWHDATAQWIMATVLPDQHKVRFFGSRNLRDWEALSDFGPAGATGGVWECPDLFALPVDNDPSNIRWVLDVDINPGGPVGGSAGQYFVGTFDGRRFVNDNPADQILWVDYGKDFYAEVSFSDIPASDGRRIWMGWVSNWLYANEEPTLVWRGAQSIPRQLQLRRLPDGIRLVQAPISEVATLRESAEPTMLKDSVSFTGSFEAELELERGDWRYAGLRLSNAVGEEVTMGVTSQPLELFVDRRKSRATAFNKEYPGRHTAPIRWREGRIRIRLLFDRSILEIFGNDGESVITERVYPTRRLDRLEIMPGVSPSLAVARIWRLQSVWSTK